ncbi:MAG: Cobalamin synthase [Syntrophorhabdus sp. PtaB.Bin047]|nr:MAG: Cobalamin synthase [Syntrophorhabdus sp. PtaB.Bin047]
MKRILIAFQFLTIIPIRIGGRLSEDDLSLSAVFFPLVGFVQGVVLATAAFFSLKIFSPAVTSLLVMAVYLVSNGAFHQDGLSDTVDALSVKSTGDTERDREKRLAVMRDPTAGPVGVVAIMAALLFKYVLICEVIRTVEHSLLNPAVLLMPAVAAWSMTMMMPGAKSARNDGLGRIFLGRVHARHACLATIFLICLALIGCLISGYPQHDSSGRYFLFFFAASVAALCGAWVVRRLCTVRFGGLTGDNLGAMHEVAETVLLITAALCF